MRKNYFVKLVKYLKSVYRIDEGLKSLTDDRINPTYQTSHVVSLVLFGFLLRVRSFNELNNLIKGNEFQKLCPRGTHRPKIDTIGNAVEAVIGLLFIAHNLTQLFLEKRIRMQMKTKEN